MSDSDDTDLRSPDNRHRNVIDLTSNSHVRSRDSSTSSDYMDRDSDSFEGNSRPRKRKKLTTIVIDSEDDSDPSEEIARGKNTKGPSTTPVREDTTTDSCSSDVQPEKCPICLKPMENQELGSPEHCDHIFCLTCIMEWSKKANTCPIDRQEFQMVHCKNKGKIIRNIQIERTDISLSCFYCHRRDSDRLVVCACCRQDFHPSCTMLPLIEQYFQGQWFCSFCILGAWSATDSDDTSDSDDSSDSADSSDSDDSSDSNNILSLGYLMSLIIRRIFCQR